MTKEQISDLREKINQKELAKEKLIMAQNNYNAADLRLEKLLYELTARPTP